MSALYAEYEACVGIDAPHPPVPVFEVIPGEEWRPVRGFRGRYDVSNLGRVRICARRFEGGYRLAKQTNSDGYRIVGMTDDSGKRITSTVHSLVAAVFIGPRPSGKLINHIDGVKSSNAATNLEYVTAAENAQHAVRLGLVPRKRGCGKCGAVGHWRRACKAVSP